MKKKGKRPFKPKSQYYAVQESSFDTPFDVDPMNSRTVNDQKDIMTTMYNEIMFKMFEERWNSHSSGLFYSKSVT